MTKKILVHAYGAETEPIKQAIRLVVDFAQKHPECLDVALYVYSLDKLRHPTTIASVLGPALCKALLERRSVPLSGTAARIRLVTERTVSKGVMPQAVLAIYANDAMLSRVEDRGSLLLAVAVPWNVASLSGWIAKWKPSEVGTARAAGG
ncbi:MAG: hypothetical protein MUC36_18225 [Planctomycetes bacterium]|jgi:hypothetical protein|nr:hypothetical protein [Planctomycetota bacterium]